MNHTVLYVKGGGPGWWWWWLTRSIVVYVKGGGPCHVTFRISGYLVYQRFSPKGGVPCHATFRIPGYLVFQLFYPQKHQLVMTVSVTRVRQPQPSEWPCALKCGLGIAAVIVLVKSMHEYVCP